MKALIILVILATLGTVYTVYRRDKSTKRPLVSLATFALIIALAIVGNLTRPIIPIFMAHILLLIGAWGAGLFYLFRGRYYWWIIFSPLLTIGLFLLLELLTGSGHDLI